MKKKVKCYVFPWDDISKLWRIMRLTFFIFLISLVNVSGSAFSQQNKISLKYSNVTLKDAFQAIEENSNYVFFYNAQQIKLDEKVSLNVENKTIEDILDELFQGKPISYKVIDRRIVLFPKGENEMQNILQQSQPVKGTVTGKNGEPIPGATVLIKGAMAGTVTDFDGNFQLSDVPGDAILVFSFVGFQPQEIPVAGKSTINVVLEEESIGLEEVVAIGYGSQKKRDLTGSVASVSTEEMKSLPMPSVGDAMQGKAAGVQIISNGTPGSDPTFRIRGVGTINNNNPLLVIDGVPTDSGLNQLNMDDVESIQILKDASATAIYGSRGSNGVVIVTTKKGKKGQGQISFNAYYGLQQATNMVEMLNASEFAAMHNEMMENAGKLKNPAFGDPESLGKGTDWLDALFETAPMQNYSLSYSGGSEKTTYYVSGNYFDQEGIVTKTGFKRYTLKFNSETQVLNNVKFGNNISLNHDDKYSGSYSVLNTMRALPTQPIYENGTYSNPMGIPEWVGDLSNPIGLANLVKNSTLGYNLLGSIYAEVEILKGVKIRSTAGLKANFWQTRTWTPTHNLQPNPQELAELSKGSNKAITWNWDNILTYTTTFDDVHDLTVMVGTSAQENKYDNIYGAKQRYISEVTQQLDNGADLKNLGGTANEWAMLSYMGRINYTYADKYLLTGTIRRDGSSRFGENNKWGIFPSGSFAWRISEENFFDRLNFVDDMKLRVGYGATGNQEIGNYEFASKLETIIYNFNDVLAQGAVPVVMPNPNLKWESQHQLNFGFDATLFNQAVDLTVDAYEKKTFDMLVPMDVPIMTGFSDVFKPSINAGKIVNRGVEVSVTTHNFKGDFTWDTDFNISVNRNEVKSLNDTIPLPRGEVGFNQRIARIEAGHPVDAFYGFVTDGIFQTQEEVDAHAQQVPGDDINRTSAGDIRFKDLNSDGIIDDNDRTYIGNPNPDFIFALNNRFAYKGFDLNIFIQGVYGNDIYNANRIWSEGMAVTYNQSKDVLSRWNGEGTSNSMPRAVFNDPNQNIRPSDRFIEDGSYIRLKNVTLGYTFPKQMVEKLKMSSARLYVSGANLLTITNYKGFDPEVGANGIDISTYPVTQTVSIGANITF